MLHGMVSVDIIITSIPNYRITGVHGNLYSEDA